MHLLASTSLGAKCKLSECPGPAPKSCSDTPRSWAPHQPLVSELAAGGPHSPADSSNQITKFKKSGCALKSSFAFPLVSPPSPRTTNQPTNHPLHCPRLSSEKNRPKILSNQRLPALSCATFAVQLGPFEQLYLTRISHFHRISFDKVCQRACLVTPLSTRHCCLPRVAQISRFRDRYRYQQKLTFFIFPVGCQLNQSRRISLRRARSPDKRRTPNPPTEPALPNGRRANWRREHPTNHQPKETLL